MPDFIQLSRHPSAQAAAVRILAVPPAGEQSSECLNIVHNFMPRAQINGTDGDWYPQGLLGAMFTHSGSRVIYTLSLFLKLMLTRLLRRGVISYGRWCATPVDLDSRQLVTVAVPMMTLDLSYRSYVRIDGFTYNIYLRLYVCGHVRRVRTLDDIYCTGPCDGTARFQQSPKRSRRP